MSRPQAIPQPQEKQTIQLVLSNNKNPGSTWTETAKQKNMNIQAFEWPRWLAFLQMSLTAGFRVASGSKLKCIEVSKQTTMLHLHDALSRPFSRVLLLLQPPGHQTSHSSNHERCKGKNIVNAFNSMVTQGWTCKGSFQSAEWPHYSLGYRHRAVLQGLNWNPWERMEQLINLNLNNKVHRPRNTGKPALLHGVPKNRVPNNIWV